MSKCIKVRIEAYEDCEIYMQKTLNGWVFQSRFYGSEDIKCTCTGLRGQLGGCKWRNIRMVFDYGNAPYSNIVLGELVNFLRENGRATRRTFIRSLRSIFTSMTVQRALESPLLVIMYISYKTTV